MMTTVLSSPMLAVSYLREPETNANSLVLNQIINLDLTADPKKKIPSSEKDCPMEVSPSGSAAVPVVNAAPALSTA